MIKHILSIVMVAFLFSCTENNSSQLNDQNTDSTSLKKELDDVGKAANNTAKETKEAGKKLLEETEKETKKLRDDIETSVKEGIKSGAKHVEETAKEVQKKMDEE